MSKIVCMIGVIGSGKDYRANQLVDQGYAQINFADYLRELAWELIGFEPENYEQFKQQEFILYPEFTSPYSAIKTLYGRQFLQNLGSSMRKINRDFWADKWYDNVFQQLHESNVVCSDVRHHNEIKAALGLLQETRIAEGNKALCDVEFVFCDYRSERYNANDNHSSEHLAQRILKDGFKDGAVLSIEYLKALLEEKFNENN